MRLLKTIAILSLLPVSLVSTKASAVITYLNCPTLTPLPVTAFMPAAMMPIKNTEMAFDIGMNQVVKNAVTAASQLQAESFASSFNSIMKNMVEVSQTTQKDKMQIERQYKELMMSYETALAEEKMQLENMMFPGDPSLMQPKPGEVRQLDSNSPSYRFVKEMCSAGKLQQAMISKKIVANAIEVKNRKSQKIVANIQAVSSVSSKAKENIDRHYDIFCSGLDATLGLCEESSLMPNADLDAGVFLYPTGYVSSGGSNDDYSTAFTYSPAESLAAYQYIKNLSGSLYLLPPTLQEMNNPNRVRFVGGYKQLVAALSMATDSLMYITQQREPINTSGLIMSQLDSMNYLVQKEKLPKYARIVSSASDVGQLTALQKKMAIQRKIELELLKIEDRLRQVKSARVALELNKNSLN